MRQTGLIFQVPTMSTPLSGDEPYPGQDYSVSQLLHAIRRKLEATTSYGRFVEGSWVDNCRCTEARLPQDRDILERS